MRQEPQLEPKLQRMLELLAQGASTLGLAKKMGFSEGTVRVYLHNLYRMLGVKNRTQAVLWQIRQGQAVAAAPAGPAPALEPGTFGDTALRHGLLASLGIMESFLGPYGRVWHAGLRMKGTAIDDEAQARCSTARLLWRALLEGDFAVARAFQEDGQGERLAQAAPSEAALLAALLLLGGYTHAAGLVQRSLPRARKGVGLSVRESDLLVALQAAIYSRAPEGLATLQRLSSSAAAPTPLRHIAAAALFHVRRAHKDMDRAAAAAEALWAEAESDRRQLEAMGVRTLLRAGEAAVRQADTALAVRVRTMAER